MSQLFSKKDRVCCFAAVLVVFIGLWFIPAVMEEWESLTSSPHKHSPSAARWDELAPYVVSVSEAEQKHKKRDGAALFRVSLPFFITAMITSWLFPAKNRKR